MDFRVPADYSSGLGHNGRFLAYVLSPRIRGDTITQKTVRCDAVFWLSRGAGGNHRKAGNELLKLLAQHGGSFDEDVYVRMERCNERCREADPDPAKKYEANGDQECFRVS